MGTDIHGVWQANRNGEWVDIPSDYTQDRHYQLFAVLADVRNGYGFAGVPTGDPVVPIAEPRGLPADFLMDDEMHPIAQLNVMDPRRQKYHENDDALEVWMGYHSHSWLSGEEMLEWWKNSVPVVIKVGVLSKEQYDQWDGDSDPPSYCGGVSGSDIVLIDNNEEEKLRRPNWNYIRVIWKKNLYEELSYFFSEVAALMDKHSQIRFVFGFDS